MCGIIGYTGSKKAGPVIVCGLKRLEYRGYDSSGIAVSDEATGTISVVKATGKVDVLSERTDAGNSFNGCVGIGHTRWATHGAPNDINSHPHLSLDGRFAVVHNGIIENFAELRAELESKGVKFLSDTDSEVIPQLLSYLYDGDVIKAMSRAARRLSGSYAIGVICSQTPDTIYAMRKDNPLVIGLGKNENFIASDYAAALEYTHDFIRLDEYEIAKLTAHSVTVYSKNGRLCEKTPYRIDWDVSQAEKNGYSHFMLKEIYEQPKALTDTVRPRVNGDIINLDGIDLDDAFDIKKIDIIGCGSAYHAGIVGKQFIEKHCRIPVTITLASEYIYSDPITDKNTLTVIISQSGETADTYAAERIAKSKGSRTVAIVNVIESAIARDADDVLYTHAGPEIAVATTKGYTTQIAALYLVGLKIARIKGSITEQTYIKLLREVEALPEKVDELLADVSYIKEQAQKYAGHHCAFFIGRGADYAASLEGALKLKEISYIHAEAYAAGELKHGTISLIEPGTITLALATQASLVPKMISNIKSVITRGGTVLSIVSPAASGLIDFTDKIVIPQCDDDVSPVLTAVALQVFAYYVAAQRGCDIDKPRNLAKSVTVE